MGSKYHEGLSPEESARFIIRHVTDGKALAQKNGLPSVITDFIMTHHGTSRTGYFYSKFINDGGDPARGGEFQYPGPNPRTTEQVIVMLCDSIEAASRTLKNNSQETFDAFVEDMVAAKIRDGQLKDAEISMKDLETVKATLKSYLTELYHGRIVYPKSK